MTTIPASHYANVTPGVLSAGGTSRDTLGMFLSTNTRIPNGVVLSFASYASVVSYFGTTSVEAVAAAIYFAGFDNSNKKPSAMFIAFAQTTNTSAFLRGGSVASLNIPGLQAITSGTLTVTIDGTIKTSSAINLSTATSFSAAATLLSTQLGAAVSFDSIAQAFVITSGTAGASSTITVASGGAANILALTTATGAITSQGMGIQTGAQIMNAIANITLNWATFAPLFVASSTLLQQLAAWQTSQTASYAFVYHSTDITDTQSGGTSSATYLIKQANNPGCVPIYAPVNLWNMSAFVCGAAASIDFTELAGRITFAYKSQSGLAADVTDLATAAQLEANGLNYYGAVSTANDGFTYFYPGTVTGPFGFLDSYINQGWLNNNFQLDLLDLLTKAKSIPYNEVGKALIRASLADTINQAKDFGAFSSGVILSQQQIQLLQTAAGFDISGTLFSQGSYLQVRDSTPQTRAARASPPCTFWYTDGGSVQQINLSSIEVQ